MTKIVYLPHCARCGALINEEVTYSDEVIKDETLSKLYLRKNRNISPYSCKNCGAIFDNIKIIKPRKIVDKEQI